MLTLYSSWTKRFTTEPWATAYSISWLWAVAYRNWSTGDAKEFLGAPYRLLLRDTGYDSVRPCYAARVRRPVNVAAIRRKV